MAPKKLVDAVPELFNNPKMSDITIRFSGREVKCHKLILGVQSPYFEKLLEPNSPFAEQNKGVVELFEDDPDSVEAMIRYFYQGEDEDDDYFWYTVTANATRPDWQVSYEIMQVAEKYLVSELRDEAETSFKSSIKWLSPFSKVLDAAKLAHQQYPQDASPHELLAERLGYLVQGMRSVEEICNNIKLVREHFPEQEEGLLPHIKKTLSKHLDAYSSSESRLADICAARAMFLQDEELVAPAIIRLERTLERDPAKTPIDVIFEIRTNLSSNRAVMDMAAQVEENRIIEFMKFDSFRETASREALAHFAAKVVSTQRDIRVCQNKECSKLDLTVQTRTQVRCSCGERRKSGSAFLH